MLNIPGKMYSTYALKQHHLSVFSGNIKCHSNTKDAYESSLSQTPPPLHSPVLRLVCHTNLHLPTIKHLNFSNDSDIVVVQLVRRSTPNSFYLSSSPPGDTAKSFSRFALLRLSNCRVDSVALSSLSPLF